MTEEKESCDPLRREVIWLGIVSVSYLDDFDGTFMFHLPEKLLAINLATILIEKSRQQELTVEQTIDKYELRQELESVRSGKYRGRDGPSVASDILEHHASKKIHDFLSSFLELHPKVYSRDNLLVYSDTILQELYCKEMLAVDAADVVKEPEFRLPFRDTVLLVTPIEVMSEQSILILRLLSAVLNNRPLIEQEMNRVQAENIDWSQSFDLKKTISAVNNLRRDGFFDYRKEICYNGNPTPDVFSNILYHVEGAKRKLPLWRQLASIIYVFCVGLLSVLTIALNFGDRPTAFERITDGLAVASAMLITVFGLLKLTSEDPNAIRNSLLGVKVLKTPEDVARECRLRDIEELKIQMSKVEYAIPWVSDQQTSYLKHSPTGSMVVPGGLSVGRKGFSYAHTFGNRLITANSPVGMQIITSSYGTARAVRTDWKLPFVTVFLTKVRNVI